MKKLFILIFLTSIYLVSSAQTNVLVCGSEPNTPFLTDIQSRLVATGQFTSVSVFNSYTATPSVAQLLAYHAVLVYTDVAPLDATTLGNNLASYIDQGGGVVNMTFDANVPYNIQGAYNSSTYRVITPTGSIVSFSSGLGAVLLPGHPIMNGVTSFVGGSGSFRSSSTTLIGTAYRIANWADGLPLISAREGVGPSLARRADLNFFPPSSAVQSNLWTVGTSGATIMANALTWVKYTPITITNTPTSGCINSTIVITGTGFTGITAVRFGTQNAVSFSVQSSTTIFAVVPAGPSGYISVVSPSYTATGSIFFTPQTPLAIGSCPSNIIQCNNAIATWTDPILTGVPLNILICGSEQNTSLLTDVQSKLQSTAQFTSVSVYNTLNGTPPVSLLQSYNAVLVFTDFAPLDATTLGNNLAAYIDGGGGVVSMAFDGISPYTVAGAYNTTTYRVTNPTGSVVTGSSGLGAVLIPAHPIMNGVTSFAGGSASFRSSSTTLIGTSYRIANWADGLPLISAREGVGPSLARRVDLNFYSPSSTVQSNLWTAGTGGATIMANALKWVTNRFTISCSPSSGSSFAPGTTTVTCSASNTCNTSSCSFTVTLNIAPAITCPSNITQCNNHVVTWTNPTATGLPTPTVVCSPTSGSTFPIGATVVNCSATNTCGSSGCSFTVTINDGPVISGCPSNITQCNNPVATWANPLAIGAGNPNVLVCGSEITANAFWLSEIQSRLISTGQFNTVSVFNSGLGTPTVAQLMSYQAVLVFTDLTPQDPTTLGNNLATYINNGGGVVSMTFDDASIPIQGAYNSATYRVLSPGGVTQGSAGLGTVLFPSHPIMNGVTTFSGGTSSYRSTSITLNGPSYRIVNWSDGLPLITARENVGPALARRADLNFFPASNISRSDFWVSTTNGATIMANALKWVALPVVSVVPCSPPSGFTFPVGTTVVNCTSQANSCGTSTCSFSVTINTSPLISGCPNLIMQCDNHVVSWTNPASTGLPVPSIVCTPASGSTFAAGTTSVTCVAANTCGSSGCLFSVIINDSPVIGACPSNITQCNNHVATFSTPTASGTPAPSVVCSPSSGSTFASGTTTVTCTATNSCGSSSCSFTVTINDSPVISACPGNISQCDNHIATWTDPTATGTPAPSVVCSPASGSTFAAGTTTVTCTASNSCGSSSCSFSVTINDSPVISACPGNISQCDNHIATWTDPTAAGTPAPSVVCSPASGSTFAGGTTTVTCTASNSCGSSSCSFSVTINDSPVISACPGNISQCDNHVATWTDPTAAGTPAPSVVCSPASGSTFAAGTTTVTCTATNSCGSSSCSFTVTINDSPVISACPSNQSLNTSGACSQFATWAAPSAAGTPTPTVVCSPVSGSSFPIGASTVTCTASNSCGSSSCTFTVTVVDNEAPGITCPSAVSVNTDPGVCGATVTYSAPVVSDNCSSGASQSFAYTGSLQSFTVPAGVTSITIQGAGAQGGSNAGDGGLGALMQGKFSVTPGQQLQIIVGGTGGSSTQSGSGGGGGTYVVLGSSVSGGTLLLAAGGGGGSGDNACGPRPGIGALTGTSGASSQGGQLGGSGGNGGQSGFCCAGAAGGGGFLTNGATCPSGGGYNGAIGGQAAVNGAAGGTGMTPQPVGGNGGYGGGGGGGNRGGGGGGGYSGGAGDVNSGGCGLAGGGGGSFNAGSNQSNSPSTHAGNGTVLISWGFPTLTQTAGLPSGATFPVGTTTNTFVATDASNNSSTCSFAVTVADNENPVIGGCPASITQCSSHVATWANPVATDNCSATVACSPASGSTFSTGTTTVTCTATDPSLHTSSCSFTVTINDGPVIATCPGNITQCDNHIATWTAPTATGTPTPSVTCSPASGSTFIAGTTTVTCTATNSCGSSNCSFSVTINDGPVIGACPSNITQCDNHVATFSTPAASGTPAATVACSPASGFTFGAGATVVTCTATNSCGASSCSFSVTINDSPVIGACPSNITTCNPVVTYATPSASGSPSATVTCSPASGSTFAIGSTTVTCTASNVCGSSSCTFSVNVQTPSVAATGATSNALYGQVCLGGNVTLTASGGSLGSGASWAWYDGGCGTGTFVGNGALLTLTPALGTHNYFVRAEGACGNTACQSVAVSVITAPPSNTIHYTASITDGCVSAPAAVFTVNTVANCTFYNWSSSDAGIRFNGNPSPFQTNTPTVNVTFVSLPGAGNSGWSVCVFGGNACGNTNTVCTWVRATVSKPTTISGSVIGCPGSTGNAYSSAAVGGAATYQWSATGGMVINNNGSQNVTVDFPSGFVSGVLSVHGQTSCGYNGLNATLTITAIPSIPGTISGTSYPCPNASSIYSVAAVPGAVSYNWTTSVPGALVTGTSNSCSILFPATIPNGSSVTVVANSGCPTSSASRSKGIASGMPGVPASINGPATGQCGQTGVSYSITPMPLATGYNWSTTCGTLVGPTNLSGVTVDWPASFTTCTLSVSATNSCGTGTARILAVAGAPAIPGAITGNAAPCANTAEFYSTAGSAGATSYTWTVPAGAIILGPANGASILVQWGATSGNITVRGSNACGNSAVRSLPCVISCRMSQVQTSAGSFNAEVYPNPASDKATVKFTATSSSQYHLNMSDVLGQHVLSLNGDATEGQNMIELNLSPLAKGVYQLQLNCGEGNEQIRLVVE